jgi:hypothetical protein
VTTKVISFKKFLEVIWQADRIKLNDIPFELLYPAWVDISVNEVQGVQEVNTFSKLGKYVHHLII